MESRVARWRDSEMEERRRERVSWCSWRWERWRVRLFCFRAEVVRCGSLVRRRVSCVMRASRCFWGEVWLGFWKEEG